MSGNNLLRAGSRMDLVRCLVSEGDRIFTLARARELAGEAGISDGYLRQALHHLARTGWVIRLRKGIYAISSAVPGSAPVHEFEIAMSLVKPAAISHWSALSHHGLTEQVPGMVFVLTTTDASVPRLRDAEAKHGGGIFGVGDVSFRFVQVKPERFFGTVNAWIGEARVKITDPERTLLDGLNMPQYCGDFANVLHAFRVRGASLDIERIVDYALRLDAATAKRLGWVLEKQGIAYSKLKRLAALPIKGYRKLDPKGPRRGPTNSRWMIQENLPGKVNA